MSDLLLAIHADLPDEVTSVVKSWIDFRGKEVPYLEITDIANANWCWRVEVDNAHLHVTHCMVVDDRVYPILIRVLELADPVLIDRLLDTMCAGRRQLYQYHQVTGRVKHA